MSLATCLTAKNALAPKLNMKTSRVALAYAVIAFFTVPLVAAPNQSPSTASNLPQQSPPSSAAISSAPSKAVEASRTRSLRPTPFPPIFT